MLREFKLIIFYNKFSPFNRYVDGHRHFIKNPLAILRSHALIKISDGGFFSFDHDNKMRIVPIIEFSLSTGIKFNAGEYSWSLSPDSILCTQTGIRFTIDSFDSAIFYETFLSQIHFYPFETKGKVVITGGAFVGDTPLYYSSLGAKVYGFEPDPRTYQMALRNIELNPELSTLITLENSAIGDDSIIDFSPNTKNQGGFKIYEQDNNSAIKIKIKSQSITSILEKYNIQEPFLLDLDIKGSEFEVLDDDSLRRFKVVRIEYSPYLRSDKYNLTNLINRLKGLNFTQIRVFKHNNLRFNLDFHGTIEAWK